MAELTADTDIERTLRAARTIAVLGAHNDPTRPASYVPEYLHSQGYRILAVNPALAGRELWGQPVRATLTELREPVDIVDIFRRPDQLAAHIPDILAMEPLPRVVWLQQGIRNDDFARAIQAAGIDVVQDHCTLADHRRLRVGRVG